MNFDEANRKRDRRLRRRLLQTLRLALTRSPSGELSGRALVECAESGLPPDQRFEDDEHALRLLRELAAEDLVLERDVRTQRGQRFALATLSYKIAARGLELCSEACPPAALVDDERVEG